MLNHEPLRLADGEYRFACLVWDNEPLPSGQLVALAAWLVCRALRRAHAPSRLLCWLWLAVGLRFVLPWGIPLKPVSYTHLTLPTNSRV